MAVIGIITEANPAAVKIGDDPEMFVAARSMHCVNAAAGTDVCVRFLAKSATGVTAPE